ncbi:MAG: LysR family transcriptional regulator, partial [Actinomycetota bacterium]|nr:LysR family transcriptional regulator [Actinomycetota bacterium]
MSHPTGDGSRDGGSWPDVTLTQLEYFGAVAETGSFTAAARRLHVAQSSLSRTVAALERRFGVELATRDARGVALTPAGEAFRSAAQAILEARTAGLERFRRFTDGEAGAVHVAALPSLVRHRLGPTIRRFRERRPGVAFTIGDAPAATIMAQVGTGTADLGIANHPASPGELWVEPLFVEPVRLAVPRA